MKKIFIRSPYFIEIDEVGQTSAKIEVFLWNKGTTEPTNPNYTFTKQIPSPTQTKLYWNVSNLAKSFIKPIAPVSVLVPTEENVNTWCYIRVVSYSDDVEILDEVYVCLNGYTNYLEGYNQSTTDTIAFKHPAIFPEKLAEDHIITWSNENDIVYDCFGGSGTVAKMAHKWKRQWILSEISKEYVEIANKRIKPYLNQTTLF